VDEFQLFGDDVLEPVGLRVNGVDADLDKVREPDANITQTTRARCVRLTRP
jgi:hypothetical protein